MAFSRAGAGVALAGEGVAFAVAGADFAGVGVAFAAVAGAFAGGFAGVGVGFVGADGFAPGFAAVAGALVGVGVGFAAIAGIAMATSESSASNRWGDFDMSATIVRRCAKGQRFYDPINAGVWLQCPPLLANNPLSMSALLSVFLQYLNAWHDTLQHLGWIGVLAYAAGVVLLGMVLTPLAPFGLAAGAIFGFWGGVVAITLGTVLGAAINFLIARHVARAAISRYLAHHEKFRLIDAAIGREGWKIIAMLRLCPMPFGLANYCYGLTSIPFWPYFFATFFAIIPANCFFVWLGASAQEGLAAFTGAQRPRHPAEYAILGVGLIAGFCALSYITRLAKAAVAKSDRAATGEASAS